MYFNPVDILGASVIEKKHFSKQCTEINKSGSIFLGCFNRASLLESKLF